MPLRGWVGETMAMDMLAQQTSAIEKVATPAHHTSANSTLDAETKVECHETAEAADPAPPTAAPARCASYAIPRGRTGPMGRTFTVVGRPCPACQRPVPFRQRAHRVCAETTDFLNVLAVVRPPSA